VNPQCPQVVGLRLSENAAEEQPLSLDKISHISRNSLSVYLPDSVLHSHQIAARRLRGVAQWVLGEFRLMHPTQEFVLLPETFDCSGGEFFHKLRTVILRSISGGSSHGRSLGESVVLFGKHRKVVLNAEKPLSEAPLDWRTDPS
jgi:hypothetical protein